jgi:hypothetical protein
MTMTANSRISGSVMRNAIDDFRFSATRRLERLRTILTCGTLVG